LLGGQTVNAYVLGELGQKITCLRQFALLYLSLIRFLYGLAWYAVTGSALACAWEISASSSANAVSFSSGRTTKRFRRRDARQQIRLLAPRNRELRPSLNSNRPAAAFTACAGITLLD